LLCIYLVVHLILFASYLVLHLSSCASISLCIYLVVHLSCCASILLCILSLLCIYLVLYLPFPFRNNYTDTVL
jgi:hypothetical protein